MRVVILTVLATCVLTLGCGGERPTDSSKPMAISPSSARLAIGQSQVFDVSGGNVPIVIYVSGCWELVNSRSCVLVDITGRGTFKLDQIGRRRWKLTFIDASLKPIYARLYLFGRGTHPAIEVPLDLVY